MSLTCGLTVEATPGKKPGKRTVIVVTT